MYHSFLFVWRLMWSLISLRVNTVIALMIIKKKGHLSINGRGGERLKEYCGNKLRVFSFGMKMRQILSAKTN